jgi:hypothetical protein
MSLLHVVRVAEQVGRGEQGPRRDLLGEILGGDEGHFQIAALHRDQLGALLEQGGAEVWLEVRDRSDLLAEHPHRVGPDVLLRDDGREAERRCVLRKGRPCGGAGYDEGAA